MVLNEEIADLDYAEALHARLGEAIAEERADLAAIAGEG